MNNVIALNSRNSTPFKFAVNAREPFDLNFFLGVTVFGFLPQVVAVAYYGVLVGAVLGTCISAGIGLGFAIERLFPYRIQTLALNASTQTRARIETINRKAA